jgi:hypothetical protein
VFLIGNDAEFILTRNKVPASVIGLIGGSKDEPLPVERGALQEDNVLAEINIVPAASVDEWELNINTVVKQLTKRLPAGIKISKMASALYPDHQLLHPFACKFGCDPDFNAWTGKKNPAPELPADMQTLRSAGGHIHIGINDLNDSAKRRLVRVMDTVMGLQTVLLDKDSRRKALYGKAGAFRYKNYGVEWRTPSNFWIFDRVSRAWAYSASYFCAENMNNKKLGRFVRQDVVDIINTNDKKQALIMLTLLNRAIRIPIHRKIS